MDQYCQCCNTHFLQPELFLSPCSCASSLPVSNPFTQSRLPSPSPSLTLPPNIPPHDQLASIEEAGIQGSYDAEAIMRDFSPNMDVDRVSDNNETALTLAAAGGHNDIVLQVYLHHQNVSVFVSLFCLSLLSSIDYV